MADKKFNPAMREGDTVETEWSQVSYNLWCRAKACCRQDDRQFRVVDIYEVVRSVIEQDLTDSERTVALMRWYDGLEPQQIAVATGTSPANIYKTIARAGEKVRLVLKHIADCEVLKTETDEMLL